jgi:A/G-specific adenine glycosylase
MHGQGADGATEADDSQRGDVWERLLAWYAAEGRAHLPWRHTRDPYAVIVSEVMLQQTQVERVLPKYREWMARFPTLAALAAASAGEAIQAWAGLGYNSRAVRLHAIARQVVAEYGGALPGTLEGLLALKGIGRYTAGAVACFAFGLPVATVDTNIRRVLWRVFRGIEPAEWLAGERAAREILGLAQWALPAARAYDWQQALMDLGATVCVSRRPLCERCPLRACCAAYTETAQATLFPSGEALARLRDERAAGAEAIDADADETETAAPRLVAERPAAYTTGAKREMPGKTPGRKRGKRETQPFTSTSRYYRGRVVEALRGLAPGESLGLDALGPRVKADYAGAADAEWLRALVAGLARDGLARIVAGEQSSGDERVALP